MWLLPNIKMKINGFEFILCGLLFGKNIRKKGIFFNSFNSMQVYFLLVFFCCDFIGFNANLLVLLNCYHSRPG